jgi:hypothetical protein
LFKWRLLVWLNIWHLSKGYPRKLKTNLIELSERFCGVKTNVRQ